MFSRCPQCDGLHVDVMTHIEDEHLAPLVALADIGRDPIVSTGTGTIFDRITEHGAPLGRVILFYGAPGSGKSHHARKLLYAMKSGIYFCYEERLEVVKGKFCELGAVEGFTRVFFSTVPFDSELVTLEKGLVVVDSLQLGMVGDPTMEIGSARMLIAITAEAMRIVREHPRMIVVLIAHETKDDKAAGPRTVEHMVDVSMSIRRDDVIVPTVVIGKNRCGASGAWDIP